MYVHTVHVKGSLESIVVIPILTIRRVSSTTSPLGRELANRLRHGHVGTLNTPRFDEPYIIIQSGHESRDNEKEHEVISSR